MLIHLESTNKSESFVVKAEVTDGSTIEKFKWEKPKHDEVVKYLVDEKQFDLERVTNALKRLEKSKEKTSQRRMDSFFKPVASSSSTGFKRKKGDTKGKGKTHQCRCWELLTFRTSIEEVKEVERQASLKKPSKFVESP